ncbi:hypothetical protein [Leptolyngbya sp. FACHB-261]|uniref:hypothetical protein n=1 Tax=Leptolyngbya sp. FACHB-261 TaxID=2692806 RepID=UPI0016888B13|nr:hypothetical protein [Leptolyngbya sp. FACHB-261]MBD2100409.1 hypothetical protein [Leptolyngbya sp. FACHB-261]
MKASQGEPSKNKAMVNSKKTRLATSVSRSLGKAFAPGMLEQGYCKTLATLLIQLEEVEEQIDCLQQTRLELIEKIFGQKNAHSFSQSHLVEK